MIKFTKRNEDILHCRFCGGNVNDGYNLFETSPVKGIVCRSCKEHLEDYLEEHQTEIKKRDKDIKFLIGFADDLKESIKRYEEFMKKRLVGG